MTKRILDNAHWRREEHIQRMTREEWAYLLLNYQDQIVFEGVYRQLIAKNIGCGVMEISKSPLPKSKNLKEEIS